MVLSALCASCQPKVGRKGTADCEGEKYLHLQRDCCVKRIANLAVRYCAAKSGAQI